ncbi:ABC transporter permease [Massilia glaciei]|uniref:ABC transporter permease n=1 Tax=Massilia glaciei TaxID=1524097 RepID=A0A2U2HLN1_9BURK|nr:ABC transporter permease [Massilia glaciei]PWF48431.1 ABC transporter permease [Massilia glaciei]
MFKNYLLTAYKVFMRRKLFTAINLLCIVLTLVVLLVITAMLQHAFYPVGVEGKSARFLQVMQVQLSGPSGKGGHRRMNTPVGYKVIDKYFRPMKSVELVSAVTLARTVSVYQQGRVTTVELRRADANYWKILDFTVLSGRVPSEDDVARGRFVAVLNATTAAKLFPGSAALGQKFSAGGQTFEVIGVVEDEMHVNAYADVWVPVTTYPTTNYKNEMNGDFTALLLAGSAADVPQIRDEVALIAKTMQFDDPTKWNEANFWADSKLDLFAREIMGSQDEADSGAGRLLALIAALMLVFMLLPALNLVNLNMGRIMERSSEIGVRKAFGATSAQLVWQLVIENILLCVVGGLIGLLCAQGILMWISNSDLIPYTKIDVNLAVFGYGMLITIVFGLLSGVIPAWKMSRLDPVFALKGAA